MTGRQTLATASRQTDGQTSKGRQTNAQQVDSARQTAASGSPVDRQTDTQHQAGRHTENCMQADKLRRTLTCNGQPAADKPIDKQTKRAHAGTEKKSRSERGTHPGTDAANSCAWAKQSAGRESARGQGKAKRQSDNRRAHTSTSYSTLRISCVDSCQDHSLTPS